MQLFDAPFHHLLHHHRGLQKVSSVLGIERSMTGSTDDVPGAPDALQARSHRRWGFHLNDKLYRTHVNAQFQRTRRHHCAQRAFFKHGLSHGAFVFRYRAVMRSGNHCRRLASDIHSFHQLRWVAA